MLFEEQIQLDEINMTNLWLKEFDVYKMATRLIRM